MQFLFVCVCVLLTSGTLCWSRSGSASASTTGASVLLLLVAVLVLVEAVMAAAAAAADEAVSSPPPPAAGELGSRHGLPGMIPADLAARSMAPERATTC